MSLFLKILLGILFVGITTLNNTISTQQKVNKRADKHGTEPMTGKQFRFMLFLNIVMTTGFYVLFINTFS